MVSVPNNVFVSDVVVPVGSPILSDPRQFSGPAVNVRAQNNCPQPFGNATGPAYCQAWCINSCPNLNPSSVSRTQNTLAEIDAVLPHLASAESTGRASFANQTLSVTINGLVVFPALGVSTAVVTAVIRDIQTQLPSSFPYPITFSCDSTTAPGYISCNVSATVASSQRILYTTQAAAPYSFSAGILFNTFGTAVSTMLAYRAAAANTVVVDALTTRPFVSIALQISQRFVSAMGANLYSTSTLSQLGTALGGTVFALNV